MLAIRAGWLAALRGRKNQMAPSCPCQDTAWATNARTGYTTETHTNTCRRSEHDSVWLGQNGSVTRAHEGGTMHACMYVVLCLTASNATRPPSVHGSRSRALISSPLPSHTPKLELHACMLSSVLFCSFGRLPNPGGGRKEEHFAGVRG